MHVSPGTAALTSVLTVSQLNERVRDALDTSLDECWVVGEISNFRVPPSGHFYFSLKDRRCQVAAVMFRAANQLLPFRPEDGMEVIVRGRIGLYAVRGDLQLYIEAMEPRGLGALQLALEQLRARLAAEGVFAPERKRVLPFLPQGIGIVTALNGAVIHDLLVVLRARLPSVRVVVRPVRVQGKEAPPDIVQAIADLNQLPDIDVLIVGRGGGSLEDLWAFNDERVVRAIAASRVPVVSAVGHESDVTLADLAADQRAPTPTAAAALAVPDRRNLIDGVGTLTRALRGGIRRQLQRYRDHLLAQHRHLRDPRQVLKALQLRVDELSERAARGTTLRLRLARQQLRGGGERLQALSPLAVLQRGYSITRRADDGNVVRDATTLRTGDALRVKFARGMARVRVEDPAIE